MTRQIVCAVCVLLLASCVRAQNDHDNRYEHRNAITLFADYSNDSSHIILGVSENRKIAEAGIGYQRRLLGNNWIEWSYEAEIRPLAFIRDPVSSGSEVLLLNGVPVVIDNSPNPRTFSGPSYRDCQSGTFVSTGPTTSSGTYSSALTIVCGDRWTYAGGISPVGQRISFAKRHRMQPFLVMNGGFLVSPRDVPVNESSRFNFTFEGGAGFEWFSDHQHSFSLDCRLHHLSNDFIGAANPGIDSVKYRVTYSFGR